MNKNRFLLYDSTDIFSNDVIQELKNNNLLSTFLLVDKTNYDHTKIHSVLKTCLLKLIKPFRSILLKWHHYKLFNSNI